MFNQYYNLMKKDINLNFDSLYRLNGLDRNDVYFLFSLINTIYI